MKHLQALIDMQKSSVAEFKRARAARRVAKVSPPSSCIAYKC
jgi:hypothetical protein